MRMKLLLSVGYHLVGIHKLMTMLFEEPYAQSPVPHTVEAIVRSVRELSTLGFFDPQNITPDVQPIPQNKEVDVSFQVDESASTSNFEFLWIWGTRHWSTNLCSAKL